MALSKPVQPPPKTAVFNPVLRQMEDYTRQQQIQQQQMQQQQQNQQNITQQQQQQQPVTNTNTETPTVVQNSNINQSSPNQNIQAEDETITTPETNQEKQNENNNSQQNENEKQIENENESGDYLLDLLSNTNNEEDSAFFSADFLEDENNENEVQKKSYQIKTQQHFYRMFDDEIEEQKDEQIITENQTEGGHAKIDLYQSAMKFILLYPITSKDKVKQIKNCYETALIFVKWTMDYTQEASDILKETYSHLVEEIEDTLAPLEAITKKKYYLDVILFARFNIRRINELAAVSYIVQNNIHIPALPPFTQDWTQKNDISLVVDVWRGGINNLPNVYRKTKYQLLQRLTFIINETIPEADPFFIKNDDFENPPTLTVILPKLRHYGCFNISKTYQYTISGKNNYKTISHLLYSLFVNFQLLNNDTVFDYSNIKKQRVLDAVATKQIIADLLTLKVNHQYMPALIAFFFTHSNSKRYPTYDVIFEITPYSNIVKTLFPIVKEINKNLENYDRVMAADIDEKDFPYDKTIATALPTLSITTSKSQTGLKRKRPNSSENKSEKPISTSIYELSKRKARTDKFIDDFKEMDESSSPENYVLPETRILTADSLLKRYKFNESDFDEDGAISLKSEFESSITNENHQEIENSEEVVTSDEIATSPPPPENPATYIHDSEESENEKEEEEEEKESEQIPERTHIQTRKRRKKQKEPNTQEISADNITFPWAVTNNLVIKSLGTPCFEEHYSSIRNLWNPGFKSKILLTDINDPNKFAWYKSEIIKGESGPIFRVTCKTNNEISEGSSPSIAWKYFSRRMKDNSRRFNGLDLYGINIPVVHKAMWNTEGGRLIRQSFRTLTPLSSLIDSKSKNDPSFNIESKLPPLDVTNFDNQEQIPPPSWDKLPSSNLLETNSSYLHFNFSMEAFNKQPVVSGYRLKNITPEEFLEKLKENV